MISTPLLICLAVASAAIVIALMMWKPRRRFRAGGEAANATDVAAPGMLMNLAASIGLARAHADRSTDGNLDSNSWHGSHLHHGADFSPGSFHDGGGFSGGDPGGGM